MTTIADSYIERLNAHDGAGVAELFDDLGTFVDPATGGAVPKTGIAAMVARVSSVLAPRYEVRRTTASGSTVVVEWRLRGKNVGAYRPSFEPSNLELELDGVDVIDVAAERIVSVRRYFDQKELAERIGLQVIVEPVEQGGAEFGYSMRVSSGHRDVPGVIALTWIRARDEAEKDAIRGHSRRIVGDFRETPGFIGIVTGFAGLRGFTVTAWQDEDALARGISRHHASAKEAFRTTDISPGVWTSVWKPIRTNRIWTRCTACTHPNDVNDDHRACEKCGAPLPPRQTFW